MVLKLLIYLLSNTVLKTHENDGYVSLDISPNPQKVQQLEGFPLLTVDSEGLRRATVSSWIITNGPLCWGVLMVGEAVRVQGWGADRKSLYLPLTLTVTPKLL